MDGRRVAVLDGWSSLRSGFLPGTVLIGWMDRASSEGSRPDARNLLRTTTRST